MTHRTARTALLLLGLLLAAAPPCAAAGGTLEALEEEAGGARRPDGEGGEGRGQDRKEEGEGVWARLLGEAVVQGLGLLLFPWFPFEYQPRPYRYGRGYAVYGEGAPFDTSYARRSRPVAFELRAALHADADGVLGYRLRAKARLTHRGNAGAEVLDLYEPLDGGGYDRLTFWRAEVLFNTATAPFLDLDLGVGCAYLEGAGLHGGLSLSLAGDVFPAEPWAFHFAASAAAFPGGTAYEVEAALGLVFGPVEMRAGYRALWIGDASLHGPLVEAALWF